ncbi:MAG TPA: EAL domain-containing protein [Ilumatobacteraceae bacterium]|nr:EAL domain-containing protein [Ilumatobacteraceae bacterium]
MNDEHTFGARSTWVVVAGLGLLPIYLWVLNGLAADLFWDAFVGVILVIGLATVWRMPRHRGAWAWILGGQVLFLFGDLGFNYFSYLSSSGATYSFADAFYLAGYPCIAVGLVLLLRVQGPLKDFGGLVDGLIVAVGAGVFLWVFLMAPTAADTTLTVTDRLIGCAYPAGDLLLITIGAQVAVRQSHRGIPFWTMTASLMMMLLADVGYTFLSLHSTYTVGGLLDAGWWISYVLMVAAAVHPGAFKVAQRLPENEQPRMTVRRLVVLGAVTFASPVLLAVRAGLGQSLDLPALLGGTMVMFALVVFRLVLVTRELDVSRMRLFHDATHDALTGLASRTVFAERVDAARARRQPADAHAAVLSIDLDDFKSVNDSLGHAAGDRLLCVIAERLSALLRPGDTVARLGGDEFAILLESVPAGAVSVVAQRAIDTISQPVDVGVDLPVFLSASVGIAFADLAADVGMVMRDADVAMYLAKHRGKGRYEVFETGMRQPVLERLELRAELVGALDRGELAVRYQPVIDVESNRVHGFEALLRWNHPTRGEVQPTRFIGIALEAKLLTPIARWLLEEACREAQSWDPSPNGPHISVNVSPVQLGDASFITDVRRALDRSRLAPSRLLLEITGCSSPDDRDDVVDVVDMLAVLRGLGVQIALDDFGARDSSLEQLRALQVDVVKFDRTFVTSSLAADSTVLIGLIEFAHALGLDTVGKGIETVDQFGQLRATGCRHVQGFLIAHPLLPADVPAFLHEWAGLSHTAEILTSIG